MFVWTRILTVINLYILDVLIDFKTNINTYQQRNMVDDHDTRNETSLDLTKCRLCTKSYHTNLGMKLYNK